MKIIRKKPWPKWPIYGDDEKKAVLNVVNSNQIFANKQVRSFELEFEKYNSSKNIFCVGNATQGLHLALCALNIGVDDEVIVTNFSFISTASCILMQNAVPVFCDIESETLGINPNEIEKKISSKTKAIIYVHMFGIPAKVQEIMKIAKKHNLYLIEDASHAHGAVYAGKKIGNFGDISVLSLHQRKNLSCGEGGIVIAKSKQLSQKIYKLRSFGFNELSYNYRMIEFCAAIGRVRLKKLDNENRIRNNNAKKVFQLFKDIKGISFLRPQNNSYGVFHKLIIFYDFEYFNTSLKTFISFINKMGIPIKNTFPPLNEHSHFNSKFSPARGTPWKWKLFSRRKQFPLLLKSGKYPVSKEFLLKKICELHIHPTVKFSDLKDFYNATNEFINCKKATRENFISYKS